MLQFRNSSNNITVGTDNIMRFNSTGAAFVATNGLNFTAANIQFSPSNQMLVSGAFKTTGSVVFSGLAGQSPRALTVGSNGQLAAVPYSTFADDMGSHTASRNINLNGKKIVGGAAGTMGIFVSPDGEVGVNTTVPKQFLHVVGGNMLITRTSGKDLDGGSTNGAILFGDVSTELHPFGRWGIEYLNQDGAMGLNFWKTFNSNGGALNYVLFLSEKPGCVGNVGIGTMNPKEKLSVNGTVLAKEVVVSKENTYWPDYVFAPGYEMMSLQELEDFVNEHSHLPDVPTAKEVGKNGINLDEMNMILLQ